jgi:PncC family amidohydrolase
VTALPSDAELTEAVRELGERLRPGDEQLALAESCTGGLVGHLVTDHETASDHFLGGVICYSETVKERLLGVPAELFERDGAVSREVAEALVRGLFERFPAASVAVSVTGLAGPEGGEGKPVGLTWIGGGRRGGALLAERHEFPYDREGNKRAAALAALRLASRLVAEAPRHGSGEE